MRFKRIELHGFKSFARKTSLAFGEGITAVVGPNGSGKSNLADALRWVLGEQSGKLLRTRRLEDVIFSGSASRSPQGMAEVTITLDNADRRLPLDFSEVAITRRAYRSGESEYLINGRRIRLRDAQDLFLRAQLGQNAYSIIGQGLIEDLLLLRPEERRELIEEAADVKRYRLRLREAQRMQERTLGNLDRATLVRSELEPQVRRLERLAQRAQRRDEISAQLLVRLRLWYGRLWLRARQAHDDAVQSLERSNDRRQVLGLEIEQLEDAIEGSAEALADSRAQLEELRSQQAELVSRHNDLSLNQRMDEERARAADKLAASLADEIIELEQHRNLSREESEQASARLTALTQEVADAQVAAETSSTAIAEAEAEATRLSAEVARLNALLAAEKSAATEAQQSREKLVAEEAALEKELATIADKRRETTASLKTATEQLRHRGDEARSLAERVEAARSALAVAAQSVATGAESEIRQRLASLESEARALRERQQWLQTIRSQAAVDGAAEIVLGAGQGMVGLISRLIQVPAGLEAAIEAALDYHLNAIVVDSATNAEAAIDLLIEKAAGRATFLPLDSLREDRPLQLLPERGVVGVAASLVQCERRYRPLIDTLLGRVVVVEDMATARRILQRRQGSVVTRSGELLRPTGSITGGRGSVGPSHGPLALEREMAALPAEEERLEEKIAACRTDIAVAARVKEQAQRELAAREHEVAEAEQALRRVEASVEEQRRVLEKLRGEWRWQQRLEEEALRRKEALAERRALLPAPHEASQPATGVVAEDLAALQAPVAAARGAVTQAIAASAALQARVARGQAEAEGIRAQQERDRSAIERLEAQVTERRERQLQTQRQALTLRVGNSKRDDELLTLEELMERGERELRDREVEVTEHERGRVYLAARLASRQQELASLDGDEAARQEIEQHQAELATLRSLAAADGLELPDDDVVRGWLEEADVSGGESASGGEESVAALRRQLQAAGPVDEEGLREYSVTKARYEGLAAQIDDLENSKTSLNRAIADLEGIIRSRFGDTFLRVNEEFTRYFNVFFGGGTAKLILAAPEDGEQDGGFDIVAQPPGKRLQSLAQLSGGERSLAATALVFALLSVNPIPFCLLDEVDAALDDANVGRFVDTLRSMASSTQFILITHNHGTIETADNIFGVTMGPDSVSRVLSMRLNGRSGTPSAATA